MGKTRDRFKKTGDIKGKLHARMGMINGLNVAEEIKKWWQECIEKLYEKDLMTWITMMVWSLT